MAQAKSARRSVVESSNSCPHMMRYPREGRIGFDRSPESSAFLALLCSFFTPYVVIAHATINWACFFLLFLFYFFLFNSFKFLSSLMKCSQQLHRLPVYCLGTLWNWFHFSEYPLVLALQSWIIKESWDSFSVLFITLCTSFMCPYI